MVRHRSLVILLLAAVMPLSAQRTWLTDPVPRAVALELATGLYEREVTSGFTAVIIPSVRLPIGGGITLTGELPISQAALRPGFIGTNRTATYVGNPWVGLEMPLPAGTRLELGLRPGLREPGDAAASGAAGFGALTDYDRVEAWLGKVTSVRGMLHLGRLPTAGAFVTARVGGTLLVPSGTGADPELLANYGVRAGWIHGATMFSGAVTGRAVVTSSRGTVAERTTHQVGLGIESLRGSVRPSVGARVFLDEAFDNVQAILVAGFSWGW